MIWFGLKLLGIGKWLREAATGVFQSAVRHPYPAVIIALCGLLAVIWWHDSRKINKLSGQLATANQTISDMKAASAANLKAQLAQKARVEQHYKDIAHEADLKHDAELASADRKLSDYIRTHRLRAGEGGFNSSPAGSAAESGSAESGERAGPETELVAVSPEDLQICTTNTMRLLAVREWAISLDR